MTSEKKIMAEITATLVKQLRERTGAGMMECKSALVEAQGDPKEAEVVLRKRGLASAGRKAGSAAPPITAASSACWWK
jgi:elongation factor Ts